MKRITVISASVCLTLLGACDSGGATASATQTPEPAATAPAPAQSDAGAAPKVDRAMSKAAKERKAVFTLILKNFGPLGGMARGRMPFDADVVKKNSMHVQHLSAMVGDVFVTDTRGSGVESDALDAIWEQPEKFAQKIAAFETAAAGLVEVSASGDEGLTKAAIGRVGKACGSCHDDFKVDDD